MWSTLVLLFVCSVFGDVNIDIDIAVDVQKLKKEWKHPDYNSFEHFWRETYSDTARPMTTVMKGIEEHRIVCKLQGECPTLVSSISSGRVNCVNGMAGVYPCSGIDLLSFVSLTDLGSSGSADGNDIWGYTASDGKRYAITGQTDGASIVDVTNPETPEVLVFLQSQRTSNTIWRDIKVYRNYAYIVADGSGSGVQYVNLDDVISQARAQSARPLRILRGSISRETSISNCHNIAINTNTGYLYAVGSNQASGGLYAFDVNTVNGVPSYAGSFSSDGYFHDTQCITYSGPDTRYTGNEICFAFAGDTLTIIDVTNKASPIQVSRTTYTQSAYTHQGWVTANHEYLLMNDELDERNYGFNTRTLIWDIRNLQSPVYSAHYSGATKAIDHNLYIDGNLVFESNYRAGLRVLDITNIATGSLTELAYFDTYPASDSANYDGTWSNYPYFSDIVVVQDINRGLFVLSKPSITTP